MKNIRFTPECIREGNGVSACHNLRPVKAPDGSPALTPVGSPSTVATDIGHPLLEYLHADGSTSLLTASGASLTVIRGDSRLDIADCGGAVMCAAPVPEGCVTVMAEGRPPRTLAFDTAAGLWTDRGERSGIASLPVLTAETMAAMTEPLAVDAFSSPAYQAADTHLTASHGIRLTTAAVDAYIRLNARARAAGAWLQPVVARVRILDRDGSTLYLTSPVLLGRPAALSAEGTLSFSDTRSAVAGLALEGRPFRIRVSWHEADAAAQRGITARLEVSPQLHPLDPDGVAETRLTRLDATTARLSMSLPGVRIATSGAALASALVPRALASFPSVAEVAASIPVPQQGETASQLIGPSAVTTVAAERKALSATLAGGSASLAFLASPPHTFSARTACVNGNSVLWADITRLPLPAPSPLEITAESSADASAGSVLVTRDDGSSTLRTFRFDNFTPLRLSALIVYPDAHAASIRVAVGRMAVTLPLTPTPDGSMAYWLSPDLSPVKFDTELPVAVVPAQHPPVLHNPGACLIASASRPFEPIASTVIPQGRVAAVTPAARSNSSWDFGRRHFYIFGAAGIHALAVSADLRSLSAARLSHADASAGAVAPAPHGVMAAAGGALVCVSGGKVTTISSECRARALAYDTSRGELWMLGHDGTLSILTDSGTYTRSLAVSHMLASAGRIYASVAGGATIAVGQGFDEEPYAALPVEWNATAEGGPFTPRRLELCLTSADINARLTLLGDGGAGPAARRELLALTIRGHLDSPLRQPVWAPPHRHLTLTLEARASADTLLGSATLTLR